MLLYEDDYGILKRAGLEHEEDEGNRFLVLKRYPLPDGVYVAEGKPAGNVDVLHVIPANYNTEGPDMFWVHPQLARADGREIPQISGPSSDSRTHNGIVYCRWSRHWNKRPWKSKKDDIETILSRLEWALQNPSADKG
jgi:hypothetical protein